MIRPKVLFVTDPICSWCWATLPEILKSRDTLAESFDFELIMAGLQVGGHQPFNEYEINRLRKLWREISEVTGQRFSGKIPENFIYHSEIACRAVEVVKQETGDAWDFFYKLQEAFYMRAENPNDAQVLQSLAPTVHDLEAKLNSQQVVDATLAQFNETDRLAAHALPSVMLDQGQGPKLVCGGYVTAKYLNQALIDMVTAGINSQ